MSSFQQQEDSPPQLYCDASAMATLGFVNRAGLKGLNLSNSGKIARVQVCWRFSASVLQGVPEDSLSVLRLAADGLAACFACRELLAQVSRAVVSQDVKKICCFACRSR
jgi:hypothetical protein